MTQQCETRVESVPTTRWYWANGQWHSETEMREERYQVSHCVPEQREMTETYEALGIHASAQDASGQLMSEVTFKTEKPGAFVRYQLATEDEVKIASNPTNTAEIVPVGTYFVWTERNQKSSSLKYHYDIYEKTREITIPETAPVR